MNNEVLSDSDTLACLFQDIGNKHGLSLGGEVPPPPVKIEKGGKPVSRLKRKNWLSEEEQPNVVSRSLPYPRWQPVEDVFLHGIVLDTYARRHSLRPFNSDQKGKEGSGENIIWKHVHKRYKVACSRYKQLTGYNLGERTVRAIQKRWKGDHRRDTNDLAVDESGCFLNQYPMYQQYQQDWYSKYNIDGLLTCSEKRFRAYYDNHCEAFFKDLDFNQM